jgi:hypothetical protein
MKQSNIVVERGRLREAIPQPHAIFQLILEQLLNDDVYCYFPPRLLSVMSLVFRSACLSVWVREFDRGKIQDSCHKKYIINIAIGYFIQHNEKIKIILKNIVGQLG